MSRSKELFPESFGPMTHREVAQVHVAGPERRVAGPVAETDKLHATIVSSARRLTLRALSLVRRLAQEQKSPPPYGRLSRMPEEAVVAGGIWTPQAGWSDLSVVALEASVLGRAGRVEIDDRDDAAANERVNIEATNPC